MTIDSLEIIQTMLRNNGTYPGDPQALSIFTYTTDWDNRTFAICFSRSDEVRLVTSPCVHRPMQLWTREEGLTEQGRRVLEEECKSQTTSQI